MAQLQYQFQKNDEYYTPPYAVYPIMERLRARAAVWCPFDTKESAFVRVLSENGFRVLYGISGRGRIFSMRKCRNATISSATRLTA